MAKCFNFIHGKKTGGNPPAALPGAEESEEPFAGSPSQNGQQESLESTRRMGTLLDEAKKEAGMTIKNLKDQGKQVDNVEHFIQLKQKKAGNPGAIGTEEPFGGGPSQNDPNNTAYQPSVSRIPNLQIKKITDSTQDQLQSTTQMKNLGGATENPHHKKGGKKRKTGKNIGKRLFGCFGTGLDEEEHIAKEENNITDDENDDNLLQEILGDLKADAQQMGNEISKQNTQLGRIKPKRN